MPTITLTTLLSAAPERAFELSLSVDAHAASMAASGERVIDGVSTGVMALGDTVTWRAKHFGFRFTMRSQITELDMPHRFVDEQIAGPFRSWWHEHRFEQAADGTLMTDVVRFEAPAGMLGRLVNRVALTRYMTALLRQRNQWLVEALASPGA